LKLPQIVPPTRCDRTFDQIKLEDIPIHTKSKDEGRDKEVRLSIEKTSGIYSPKKVRLKYSIGEERIKGIQRKGHLSVVSTPR
jgi:hypothetical protein